MIYVDVSKAAKGRHRSGLMRVSARLSDEIRNADSARWDPYDHNHFFDSKGHPIGKNPHDWFLTTELFSEEERSGISEWLASRPCRLAAVFHDAIPLKHPHITWPHSVARHPGYMKLLARFDRVWAVSAASRDELVGFWRWQGIGRVPPVEVLALGADFDGSPRVMERAAPSVSQLLCVGIVEPRKNQAMLLEVCAELWAEGIAFELHLVGRVNPHFGRPIAEKISRLSKQQRGALWFHEAADDAALARLYAEARATVFPTIAEGCGLPLLESLWRGVPCVCSDLPVLLENAVGGGCLPVATNNPGAWKDALRRILSDDSLISRLTCEAMIRPLPTWQAAAEILAGALR